MILPKVIFLVLSNKSNRELRSIDFVSFMKENTIALCRAIVYNYSFKVMFSKIQPKGYVGTEDAIVDSRAAFLQAKKLGVKTYSFPHGINFYKEEKVWGENIYLAEKFMQEI